MSIISHAKSEMELAGFSAREAEHMAKVMELFFDEWDSGGAVHIMAPILTRCIAGKPLTPLTGEDWEWNDVSEYSPAPAWQNARCSTVFKEYRDGVLVAYDIDTPGRPPISFPYMPERAEIPSPVIEIDVGDDPLCLPEANGK